MNKKLMGTMAGAFLTLSSAQAQFTPAQAQYFVGSGSDTTLLVVDFNDGTADSSYAWGYLYNGTKTGEDMLKAVAAADVNFKVNIAGGFLNDISYGLHAGIGGSPDFWSTWSGTDTASLSLNAGIGTTLQSGQWFALSYTDFNPAAKPGLPIPAFDPNAFTPTDVQTWVGSGQDSAVLVIDFNPARGGSSYAWGYLFNDSVPASTLLSDVAAAQSNLTVNASGFLNDIIFKSDSGMGGSPNFWGTWSGTNLGDWFLNAGIGTYVKNGSFFGASYTDFAPALRPTVPTAVNNIGLKETAQYQYTLFPNPAVSYLSVNGDAAQRYRLALFAGNGQKLRETTVQGGEKVDVSNLAQGAYLVRVNGETQPLIIQ